MYSGRSEQVSIDARSRGLAVLPFCPFVKGYIERHPDHLYLVPEARRERLGL